MPYRLLLAMIQSIPAITSETYAMPLSSTTSTSTSGALGAAPAKPTFEPAAIPATIVPWPRPSPLDSANERDSLTDALIRPKKSERFWIPESTIAIAGIEKEARPHRLEKPCWYGHSWFDENPFSATPLSG